ncbi:MAG: glycosyltransferase family 4 protein [Bacteroidota bacterium]
MAGRLIMPRVLFIAAHRPDRSPSQRFRFEQYFNFLEKNGWQCTLSFLLSEKDDKFFYQEGRYFLKAIIFLKSVVKRFRDLAGKNKYDIIFIQREAFMTGSVFFEKQFRKSRAKIIFDFDDAIWNLDISDANKKLHFLKNPSKTSQIIQLSHLVFAGNPYLAEYALKYNPGVQVIPTTIETEKYIPKQENKNGTVCIGWTGSLTTMKHFQYAIPFLKKIKAEYGSGVEIKVIGDKEYINEELGIKGIAWSSATEISDLQQFDIGIMPLPDDEWAKGKCGLKGLQYMAMGIPTIMSPVGVNTDIITDGENGFLASGDEEWQKKLKQLIDSTELRVKMGEKARQTVIEKYSVFAWQPVYLDTFNKLIQ